MNKKWKQKYDRYGHEDTYTFLADMEEKTKEWNKECKTATQFFARAKKEGVPISDAEVFERVYWRGK